MFGKVLAVIILVVLSLFISGMAMSIFETLKERKRSKKQNTSETEEKGEEEK